MLHLIKYYNFYSLLKSKTFYTVYKSLTRQPSKNCIPFLQRSFQIFVSRGRNPEAKQISPSISRASLKHRSTVIRLFPKDSRRIEDLRGF